MLRTNLTEVLQAAIKRILNVSNVLSSVFFFQYVKLQPTIPLKGGKVIPYHSLMGNIEFKNVSFSYPTRPDQVCGKYTSTH